MTDPVPAPQPPTLHGYPTVAEPLTLHAGRPKRAWMDATSDRYAYRCLPLTMANSTGWELRCPFKLNIDWDGGQGADALTVSSPYAKANISELATSHFRHGIVTFHTGWLFQTPPGWGVWAMGPPNTPKDGIAPLAGLVETDWLPFPFTMNWQMTRPGRVSFAKNEPFCFITLQQHGRVAQVEPERREFADNPELSADYQRWQSSRADFNARAQRLDPEVVAQGWQRHYMRGRKQDGSAGSEAHATRRRMCPMEGGKRDER